MNITRLSAPALAQSADSMSTCMSSAYGASSCPAASFAAAVQADITLPPPPPPAATVISPSCSPVAPSSSSPAGVPSAPSARVCGGPAAPPPHSSGTPLPATAVTSSKSSFSASASSPRVAAGAAAPARPPVSIADYSSEALPLFLPLTAQTSSPSRVIFRKQLLQRLGLRLLPSPQHPSQHKRQQRNKQQRSQPLPQQQQHQQQQPHEPLQQQETRPKQGEVQQKQVEAGPAETAEERISPPVRSEGGSNCLVYLHRVKSPKELQYLCGQLLDAFRVCYMTDQDLYFADAVLQEQESKWCTRSRNGCSRRRPRPGCDSPCPLDYCGGSSGPSTAAPFPHAAEENAAATGRGRSEPSLPPAGEEVAAAGTETVPKRFEEGVSAGNLCSAAAPSPAVVAASAGASGAAETGQKRRDSSICSCCCCYCCQCCLSKEDEEELFHEWGRLAYCESPSNLRRALFELKVQLCAAAGRTATSNVAAKSATAGSATAATGGASSAQTAACTGAAAAASAAAACPVDSAAAATPASGTVGAATAFEATQHPVAAPPPGVVQLREEQQTGNWAEDVAGPLVGKEDFTNEEEKKHLPTGDSDGLQRRLGSRSAPRETFTQKDDKSPLTEDAALLREKALSLVEPYLLHIQHLINRFCTPANQQSCSSNSRKSTDAVVAQGRYAAARDKEITQGYWAKEKHLQDNQPEKPRGQQQHPQAEEQSREEEHSKDLTDEVVEEEDEDEVELSRRCHAEAKKLGVYLHPAMQIKKSRGAVGRGWFAHERISAGSVLFRIPRSAMINVYTALQDPVFGPLAEWLLTLRLDGEEEKIHTSQHKSEQGIEEEREGKREETNLQRTRKEQQQDQHQQGQLNQQQQKQQDEAPTEKGTYAACHAGVAAEGRADTATAAAGSECGCNEGAQASLSALTEEGRPLIDSDTLCLLYFLFEAHRAAATESSSTSGKTKDEGSSASNRSQEHQPQQQGQQQQQLEQKQRLVERQEQQTEQQEEQEQSKTGSKFSFFFELLPPRHEEQQQPLIAGPPEVPELLRDEPLTRAIDSTLLRAFELYRRLLPLLRDAFAGDEGEIFKELQLQRKEQHKRGEKRQQQQQQKEKLQGQPSKCRHHEDEQLQQWRFDSEQEEQEGSKVRKVSSGDGSADEAEETEIEAEAATTAAAAGAAAAWAAAAKAAPAAAKEGRRELKEWIESLTLEKFIWGQCHMGSRAFALELTPPSEDGSWRQVAVSQRDYIVEGNERGNAATAAAEREGETAEAAKETQIVAAGVVAGETSPAATSAAAEEHAAREQDEALAAGQSSQGGRDAVAASVIGVKQRGKTQADTTAPAAANGTNAEARGQAEAEHGLVEQAADAQQEEEEETTEQEDVVAFLPVLRDRPPPERLLYYRHTGATAGGPSVSSSSSSSSSSSASSYSSASHFFSLAGAVPSCSCLTTAAGSGNSSVSSPANVSAAGVCAPDGGLGFACAAVDGSRASRNVEREKRAAARDEGRIGEQRRTEGEEDGIREVEEGTARSSLPQGSPPPRAATAAAGRGLGVLHVPDHPTTFLPFVDIANHHVHAQCCFPFFDAATATATVVAHADIPAAAEIYLFYGPLQSWELLAQFGFTTDSFFALEKRTQKEQKQWQRPEQQQQLLSPEPGEQQQLQQQTERQQQRRQDAETRAARGEEANQGGRDSSTARGCGSEGEDVYLTELPVTEHRHDCCGAWSFTKEKRGNPYDTLTLCFEPVEEQEGEACSSSNSTTSTRRLLSRLFEVSTESLLRTGAPHFSPRLLDSLQVSLHPDVDELLRVLLRKKKRQQQLLCSVGRFCRGSSGRGSGSSFCSTSDSNNNSSSSCCSGSNSVCASNHVEQQNGRELRSLEGDNESGSGEEGEDAVKKEELLTLCKIPVVQTVDELLQSCLRGLKQLEYWKEHEEERPHWYDAWSSRAASHLGNQRILFEKIKRLFESSIISL